MAKSPKATTSRRPTRKPRARSAAVPPSADIEDLAPSGVLAGPTSAAPALRSGLLRWYDAHRRDLPWRFPAAPGREGREKRAYAVWVSEVMLQQTRVPVVIDYYSRWMARWPTVETLAAATQEEVNEMWAGLGYYRRARFLLEGAKQIAEKGEFPSTASTLRQVRGIGDYTAGAIASIAFNEVVTPLVDGNVVRVISRLFAIADNPKESSTVKRFCKTKPDCSQCPVSSHCQALVLSHENPLIGVTDYPRVVPKAKPRSDFAAVCVVQIEQGLEQEMAAGKCNFFLLIKRPEEGLLAGLWEFPSVLVDECKTDPLNRRKEMDRYLKRLVDIDVEQKSNLVLREDVGQHVHVFSHIRLTMHVELMVLKIKGDMGQVCNKGRDSTKLKLVDESSIDSMGLTSGIRKVYNMVKAFKEKKLSEQNPNAHEEKEQTAKAVT
ncbi:A/G-specific adenine DNA glycosylase [Hordeum vulgare]|nr:A/G-specific adenine DNA glycosylase [Hordeum vulgare]